MKNPLAAAPPRLQRMLQLQSYDMEVIDVRGKNVPISDLLSRQSLSDTYPSVIDGMDLHEHTVTQQAYVTDRRIETTAATMSDSQS